MAKTIREIFPNQIRLRARYNRFPAVVGDCWEWIGKRDQDYGIAKIDGRAIRAHRLSFILAFGSVPMHCEVCHKCDVRCCCNPDHLFAAIPELNQIDRWKWKFVVGDRFLPGDYEQWRRDVFLLTSKWSTPTIIDVGPRKKKKRHRPRSKNRTSLVPIRAQAIGGLSD